MSLTDFRLTQPLQDLGDHSDALSGIFSPVYDDKTISRYLQNQFLDDAETYVRKYQDTAYWKQIIEKALQGLEIDFDAPVKILDIGSGSGNTIFPLLDLFPHAKLIASDLSIPLLAVLKTYHSEDEKYANRDMSIMQLNAEEMVFGANQFDLVVGGAILHHLFDPSKTLQQCWEVLKPGGYAIFVEPFEIGHQVHTIGLKLIIEMNKLISSEADKLDPDVISAFERLCLDGDTRKGSDKSDPIFTHIDDKWLFTKHYFEDTAKAIGFQNITCRSIHSIYKPFSSHANTLLRLILDRTDIQYPTWVSNVFNILDENFSEDLRQDIIIEGYVALQK